MFFTLISGAFIHTGIPRINGVWSLKHREKREYEIKCPSASRTPCIKGMVNLFISERLLAFTLNVSVFSGSVQWKGLPETDPFNPFTHAC